MLSSSATRGKVNGVLRTLLSVSNKFSDQPRVRKKAPSSNAKTEISTLKTRMSRASVNKATATAIAEAKNKSCRGASPEFTCALDHISGTTQHKGARYHLKQQLYDVHSLHKCHNRIVPS
jgi:hypothetical protein